MTTEQIIESIKSKMSHWEQARGFHIQQGKLHPELSQFHEQQADNCNVRYVTLMYLLDEIEQGDKDKQP